MSNRHRKTLILISFALFLVLLPLSLKITFPQNDDWVYYGMVESFLNGNFVLDPISAPTFYSQGFVGALFSLVFSISALPVLTLFVSVLNFYVFSLIVYRVTQKKWLSLLSALIFFFNPLHIYSIWGFMTENYFVLFVLIALYFYMRSQESNSKKDSIFMYGALILGFLVKQATLFVPLGLGIYHLLKREFKQGVLHIFGFGLMYGGYLLFFPRTTEMLEKSLQFQHLGKTDYAYGLIYGSLLFLAAFLAPYIIGVVVQKRPFKQYLVMIFLGVVLFFGLNHFFRPMAVSWGEFPYFENTFERTGFYPRGIGGTKYQFRGIFDLYKYLDLVAKLCVAGFLASLVYLRKSRFNAFLVLIVVYLGLMVVTETFYDRYLIPLVPIALLYLLSIRQKFSSVFKFLFVGVLVFEIFLAYQFSMDFVLANEYVWKKSVDLVSTKGLDSSQVQGTNSWKLINGGVKGNYIYDFSYDSPEMNEGYKCCYEVVEEKRLDFPMSFFIEPRVYLYRKL
jgi:hypothetical protein